MCDSPATQAAVTQRPDGIVLIGFDESKKILQEMIKQGIGPDKVPLYLCDGNMGNALAVDHRRTFPHSERIPAWLSASK